jgi:NADH dehydrogenase
MGVKVLLNKQVKDFKDDEVIFVDGESIPTKMLIWAAGVTASRFNGIPDESFGRGNRLLVDEHNKVYGTKNIYAIGDTCLQFADSSFPEGHPQLAQVAIQQGVLLAKNIKSLLKKDPLQEFTYHDKGSMAIIGRSKAVTEIPSPKINITGWLAWAMWLFVHLFSLISYRNRLKTMYNWTIAYLTKDQTLRMIIRKDVKAN